VAKFAFLEWGHSRGCGMSAAGRMETTPLGSVQSSTPGIMESSVPRSIESSVLRCTDHVSGRWGGVAYGGWPNS
jgi:hypothetical protein